MGGTDLPAHKTAAVRDRGDRKSMITSIKNTLRAQLRVKQNHLSMEYRKKAGEEIAAQVIESEQFRKAETVFVYVSLSTEPDTRKIMEEAWRQKKTVCVPKCIRKPDMIAVKISGFGELQTGAYGIPEPAGTAEWIDPDQIDLAIIPCVSASIDGRRMGHGGGYYDAFLRDRKMYKMCLCFEEMLCEQIPLTSWDTRIDCVITEKE